MDNLTLCRHLVEFINAAQSTISQYNSTYRKYKATFSDSIPDTLPTKILLIYNHGQIYQSHFWFCKPKDGTSNYNDSSLTHIPRIWLSVVTHEYMTKQPQLGIFQRFSILGYPSVSKICGHIIVNNDKDERTPSEVLISCAYPLKRTRITCPLSVSKKE